MGFKWALYAFYRIRYTIIKPGYITGLKWAYLLIFTSLTNVNRIINISVVMIIPPLFFLFVDNCLKRIKMRIRFRFIFRTMFDK